MLRSNPIAQIYQRGGVRVLIRCRIDMNIYEELGVRPLINAWGTVTAVGGSRMAPSVIEAMREASASFVDLHALHQRAGEAIATMLGVDAACVTSGAAAGITIAAAACMTRGHADRRTRLPDTSGMPNECLMLRAHRNRYDRAASLSGVRMAEVAGSLAPTIDDVRASVTERTALFLYMAESASVPGSLALSNVVAVLRESAIPVVVDAAAELPPNSSLTDYINQGADLVLISGGKEIRGPQSSGMILGESALIAECIAHCFPNHGIGRGMKTDKETIAGLVRAVELFVRRDEHAEFAAWERMVDEIVVVLDAEPSLHARRGFPRGPGIQPMVIPRAYVAPLRRPAQDAVARLWAGDPAVAVGVDGGELAINPQCLNPDEVPMLIDALVKACS
jgi:L-seryl-tRNA(Ser) seleniumtransferase